MYKHLFGPVPSRRLGISLGVDLVPHKTCTFDCIYCECGATTNLTTNRKEYIQTTAIINELKTYLSTHPYPDYITFSGSGEPTLHSGIGKIISFLKAHYPRLSVAALTNGSLLSNPQVRQELLNCDVLLPSLDAATFESFQAINQPHASIHLDSYIEGLIRLRNEFTGSFWLEIMIIPGYNMDSDNLNFLKEAILKITPDKIQLNTLDRPGKDCSIRAANEQELNAIIHYWNLEHVEIIAPVIVRLKHQSYQTNTEKSILNLLARRPCTLTDLEQALGLHRNEINKYLSVLATNNQIKTILLPRGAFYALKR